DVEVGTGGVISVGVSRAFAETRTLTDAHVGSGVHVLTEGNVTVQATGRGEADAYALAAGGGGVQVGVPGAIVTLQPAVNASVGSGTFVTAGGDIVVNANLTKDSPGNPPSDKITDVDTGNDPKTRDTISINYPLPDGMVVQYHAPDKNSAIGGL